MSRRFERLLAELASDPLSVHETRERFSQEGTYAKSFQTEAELRNIRQERNVRSFWKSHSRAAARLKAKAVNTLAPMVKALQGQTAALQASQRNIVATSEYHAARSRMADFHKRFDAEVIAGNLTGEQTAAIELQLHRHSQALDTLGKKLGI